MCYPLASQTYQAEWDCLVLPSDLQTNQDYEALPQPWQDAVVWPTCAFAMAELKNFNASNFYMGQYEKFLLKYSGAARIGGVINPYGRW